MTTTSAINPAAATTAASSKDTKSLNQNFDQFLLLLTTQLQNQDPLSPMDSAAFTDQLVSFSGVEQQIKMNENISNLVEMSKASQTTLGLSYIGLKVNNTGNNFKYSGTGTSEFSYTLPKDAAKGKVNILDANNNIVFSTDAELNAGTHKLSWNGLDNNGLAAPAGKYKLQVGVADAAEKSFTAETTVPGIVEGIETTENGDVLLLVNDGLVPMSEIKRASL